MLVYFALLLLQQIFLNTLEIKIITYKPNKLGSKYFTIKIIFRKWRSNEKYGNRIELNTSDCKWGEKYGFNRGKRGKSKENVAWVHEESAGRGTYECGFPPAQNFHPNSSCQ